MKAVVRNLIIVAVVLLFSQAALAVGTYTYNCNSMCIWDLSGSYSEDMGSLFEDMDTDIYINYDIYQDELGKFAGSGYANGTIYYGWYDFDVDMSYLITGSVTQSNNIAKVKLNMKFTGDISYDYVSLAFKGNETLTGTIDPYSGTMNGIVKIKISIPGFGSESSSDSFSYEIPDDMDGSFTINMNTEVLEDGKKITGTSEIILSNGDSYDFTMVGKCNAKTNIDTATLQGIDAIIKSKLKAKISSLDGNIISVSGKVLGQKIKAENIMP